MLLLSRVLTLARVPHLTLGGALPDTIAALQAFTQCAKPKIAAPWGAPAASPPRVLLMSSQVMTR